MTDEFETPDGGRTDNVRDGLLVRSFLADLTAGDGRTVDARIVPYNVAEEVRDRPGGMAYREEWADGCFDEQLVAGHRLKVLVNFEHERGAPNVVGKCIGLRSQPDGLHGSFEMRRSDAGDMALELVKDGILDSVSLEAAPKKGGTVRTAEGIVRRVKAHLHNVALCRFPAFKDAKVLAVREEVILDEEILPVDIDPETIERCRRLGIKLPQRYEAHPAPTDTPAPSGTSEAAPAEGANT